VTKKDLGHGTREGQGHVIKKDQGHATRRGHGHVIKRDRDLVIRGGPGHVRGRGQGHVINIIDQGQGTAKDQDLGTSTERNPGIIFQFVEQCERWNWSFYERNLFSSFTSYK
jgi:hypothetical protein